MSNKKTIVKWKGLLFIILSVSIIIVFAFTNYHLGNHLFNKHIPKDGFVPDEATAIKIAEAIWMPIYGSGIEESMPFYATLKDSAIWIIQGTLNTSKGGVPYAEIQKSDCKVLKVTHSK